MTAPATPPTLRLRNSMTRTVEDFAPLDPNNVRLYLCGPTVYDRAHLGNARNVILFDLLFRLLRHDHGADRVTYVRNFTDIDDKIIERAAETGEEIDTLTARTTQWFLDDMAALGTLEPTHMPRATDYIAEMVAMIEGLVASGHAYTEEGHTLFSVASYDGYGTLSGRTVDDMIAGARVEVATYKRDPMDFVLWKPSAEDEPGWETSLGYGRPGWHIECSAMAKALLGETFDIHGGGNDLMFPHHENERAQSCCADPDGGFANLWLHNEMLLVEGRKMSKSLGNFFTVRDLLDRGVPGEVIRFVFLSTHYTKPMDWTGAKAAEAEATLRKWRGLVVQFEGLAPDADDVPPELLDAIRSDLNTPMAITGLHALAKRAEKRDRTAALGLLSFLQLLGFGTLAGLEQANQATKKGTLEATDPGLRAKIEEILKARLVARADKDYARADGLRDALVSSGIVITDGKGDGWTLGPDFDPAKLEGLT